MSQSDIVHRFDPIESTDFVERDSPADTITDDTQITFFSGEGSSARDALNSPGNARALNWCLRVE